MHKDPVPAILRRSSLLCLGAAFAFGVAARIHPDTGLMIAAAALSFLAVGLMTRYGLPS